MIPAVNIEELENPAEKIETRKTLCEKIPFYVNQEACNGIVYASVSFPVDRLDPADYKFLPLLSSCISGLGTKKGLGKKQSRILTELWVILELIYEAQKFQNIPKTCRRKSSYNWPRMACDSF